MIYKLVIIATNSILTFECKDSQMRTLHHSLDKLNIKHTYCELKTRTSIMPIKEAMMYLNITPDSISAYLAFQNENSQIVSDETGHGVNIPFLELEKLACYEDTLYDELQLIYKLNLTNEEKFNYLYCKQSKE